MKLEVHGQYNLVNTATLQRARIEVLELYSYRGEVIVYGERQRSGLWVPSAFGRRQAPPGPACFPMFLTTPSETVAQLVAALRSLPLFICDAGDDDELLPVLSLENASLILGGGVGVRDDMINRSRQLVNLFLAWRALKRLPEWFRLKQAAAMSKN